MSTQKQEEDQSLEELRNEHKQLVVEKERLEEQIWNSQYDVKQANSRDNAKNSD